MSFFCNVCKKEREQGCFGPRCPGIPLNYTAKSTHERAREELLALERHLTKRALSDEFSRTNLWLLVDAMGRAQ
jgi:hypothetical protein